MIRFQQQIASVKYGLFQNVINGPGGRGYTVAVSIPLFADCNIDNA
jgi:hypothetical protein